MRASRAKHPITRAQKYWTENLGYRNVIEKEYVRITTKEAITIAAQLTINVMCDLHKENNFSNVNEFKNDLRSVQFLATIDVSNYPIRNTKLLVNSMFNALRRNGVEKLLP